MDDLDYYHFDELIIEKYKKELFQFFTKISEEHSLFSPRFDLSVTNQAVKRLEDCIIVNVSQFWVVQAINIDIVSLQSSKTVL